MAAPVTELPRYPAGSSKRGMLRAIEIVEWMRDYAAAQLENTPNKDSLGASVWKQNVESYAFVVKTLKQEIGR